ncbi:MAG TPA: hypothetical protein VMD53_12390 [Rhizomicrobium sp.]|nr:hypothetical protein [Rhizomicrobium sp.]
MPCCTLIAFLLSQLGIAGGAVKVRMSGTSGLMRFVPLSVQTLCERWRWAGLVTALTVELLLAGAAAPYVFTQDGRADAASSFRSAWHLCTMGSFLTRQPSR